MPKRLKEPHSKFYKRQTKHNGERWQGIVMYYDTETGKRRQTAQTFATMSEAEKWSRHTEMEFRTNPNRKPPSAETLGDYLIRWLAVKETMNIEASTFRSYREMATHSIRELGHKPLKSLTTMGIQQFYVSLSQGKRLSVRTVNYVHTVLKMALNDAVEWDLIPKNPAAKAKARLGKRKTALRIPTPEETVRLLTVTTGTRWYALWVWFSITGTRLGEALALRWIDIDWSNKKATIRQAISGDAAKRAIKTPKSERGVRTIALGSRLLTVLRAHQQTQADAREIAGDQWEDSGLVFTTLQGKMLEKRYIERVFKQALAKADLPDEIRVHDMRHYGYPCVM